MPRNYRLYGDAAWVAAGQLVSAIATLASLKVWAVYLEPAELGLMGLIIGLASILVGIVVGPLVQGIFIGYPAQTHNGHAREFRAVGFAILRKYVAIFSAFIILVGLPAAAALDLHWITPFLIMGLFAVEACRYFELALFAAARRQKDVAFISGGDAWFRFAFLWIFLEVGRPSAYTAVAGNLVGTFIFLVLARALLRFEAYPGSLPRDPREQRSMKNAVMRLARPLFPAAVLSSVTAMSNRYLIGATVGLSAAGLFVVSYGLVKRPYGILNSIAEWTMTPVLAGAMAGGKAANIARARRIWLAFGGVAAAIGALLFYGLREPIVALVLSDDYARAADLLFGIALGIAMWNVSNILGGFSLTMGNSRAVLINNAVGCFANLVLTVTLCLAFGLIGAVWALAIGYLFQLIASILTFRVGASSPSREAALQEDSG